MLLYISGTGGVGLWDVRAGKRVCPQIRSHSGSTNSVAFMGASRDLASGGDDGHVFIYDVHAGNRVGVISIICMFRFFLKEGLLLGMLKANMRV